MTEVRDRLESLGLGEYADAFINEGFDAWSVVEEVTESDLNDLGVKLGHRRKLQRAIAESRQQAFESPPRLADRYGHGDANASSAGMGHDQQPAGRTKRKYKRHPKPDLNAPERPASAYVLFSNDMREMLKDRDLSFTDMAKIVGERWQVLPPDERESYETNAANAKEKYNNAMSEYKKTEGYAHYQQYLADFRARHSHKQQQSSGSKRASPSLDIASRAGSNDVPKRSSTSYDAPKRARLEPETSTETQSSLEDHMAYQRSFNSSQPYAPAAGLADRPHEHYSKSASPSASQYSSMASPTRPGAPDGYGPMASPTATSSSSARHSQYEPSSYHANPPPPLGRTLPDLDSGGRRSAGLTHQSSTGSSGSIPTLSKDISSRSSESSRSPGSSTPFQTIMKDGLPPSSRILPPINSGGAAVAGQSSVGKSLEHRPMATAVPPYSPHHDDPRHSSSLAALLRAGELASEADKRQQGHQAGSPPQPPPPAGS